jgi:hypothetical protein
VVELPDSHKPLIDAPGERPHDDKNPSNGNRRNQDSSSSEIPFHAANAQERNLCYPI